MYYRGRAASAYFKQHKGSLNTIGTTTNGFVQELAAGVRPRQLKNIRGEIAITTSDSTPTASDSAQGYVALVRWARNETTGLHFTEVKVEDPRVLHPVAWAFRLYPVRLAYEFRGINLAEDDQLYLYCGITDRSGSDSIYFDYSLLWAQKNSPANTTP